MWFNKKKNYKFISLKTYAWDRTINNTRRFRSVFDKREINYLSVALEFYNILFNEKDWKANITFKAYTIDGDEKLNEHCVHNKEYEITKDLNSVIIDYGWGNDERGSYWKKGDYLWEAYIEDELIESTKFHIEDVGLVSNEYNPYFKVESLKTFDILTHEDKDDENLYLKQFFITILHLFILNLI